jgi:hypothetical protein
MRAAPSSSTISYWDGAGNASKASYRQDGSWTDSISVTTIPLTASPDGFTLEVSSTGGNAFIALHALVGAEL